MEPRIPPVPWSVCPSELGIGRKEALVRERDKVSMDESAAEELSRSRTRKSCPSSTSTPMSTLALTWRRRSTWRQPRTSTSQPRSKRLLFTVAAPGNRFAPSPTLATASRRARWLRPVLVARGSRSVGLIPQRKYCPGPGAHWGSALRLRGGRGRCPPDVHLGDSPVPPGGLGTQDAGGCIKHDVGVGGSSVVCADDGDDNGVRSRRQA